MQTTSDFNESTVDDLVLFLEQNSDEDFLIFNLLDKENTESLNWTDFENNKETVLNILKGYQRILRIVPENNRDYALPLLREGIHSAIQIASMTKKKFVAGYSTLFNNDRKIVDEIYNRALDKRSTLLLQYMNILQNTEPHISAARFN